jgi:predicted N-formylglutamate amidohydrolase
MSEFRAFELVSGDLPKGLILLCDHAGNDLPADYGTLGLEHSELQRHIGYDIGARGVTLGLAEALGVPAVLSTFSRLLIDPNRGEDDPTLIRQLYDGTIIPGNYPIANDERTRRIKAFYRPYHEAIAAQLASFEEAGIVPAVVSIHTMTDRMNGFLRPWQTAILSDSDRRLVDPLLEYIGKVDGILVGDNEPYDGALNGDTLYRHCTRNGLPHALIEIRQDLVANQEGIDHWVKLLAPIIGKANGMEHIHKREWFKSRSELPGHLKKQESFNMDKQTELELEAAAYRRLRDHLQNRTDVQNIDLMNLAGFCRNCLSKWYQEAANQKGIDIDKAAAREIVYGMPYEKWRDLYQSEATPEQAEKFKESHSGH